MKALIGFTTRKKTAAAMIRARTDGAGRAGR
jgi:hypothetical protein